MELQLIKVTIKPTWISFKFSRVIYHSNGQKIADAWEAEHQLMLDQLISYLTFDQQPIFLERKIIVKDQVPSLLL